MVATICRRLTEVRIWGTARDGTVVPAIQQVEDSGRRHLT